MVFVYNSKHKKEIIMKSSEFNILPYTRDILKTMGEQIKNARLRRNLSTELICQRATISRATLWKIENGNSSVAIGHYAAVLHALGGMEKDLLLVAKDERMIKQMQEFQIETRKRAKKR